MDEINTPPVSVEGAGGAEGRSAARASLEIAVAVHDVGKVYRLYSRPEDRLKEQVMWRFGRQYGRDFWALSGVTFSIRQGERFGIIGRNGSGKSTLLQIIAGTLAPTGGTVQVRGRVAALLELGSGFNLEFTGRENVLMNAALLGLTPAEIAARYDGIVAFADIGAFIDQPAKTYSSGMLVRLAFAVATAVDADVLLVDEALAVGDVFFRQKCYRRLDELRERGTAVILVSHAMTEVEQFCERALLLDRGRTVFLGTAPQAVRHYYLLAQDTVGTAVAGTPVPAAAAPPDSRLPSAEAAAVPWPERAAWLDLASVPVVSNGWARCTGVALCDAAGNPSRVFEQGQTALFFYEFEALRDLDIPIGGVVLQNDRGVVVHGKSTLEYGSEVPAAVPAGCRIRFRQEISLGCAVGDYTFEVGLATMAPDDYRLRDAYAHSELHSRIVRVCHLPAVGRFAVGFRRSRTPVQLTHHGVADLPGTCAASVIATGSQQDLLWDAGDRSAGRA